LFSLYIDSLNDVWFSTNFALGKIDPSGKVQKDNIEHHELSLKKIEGQFIVGYLGSIQLIDKVKVNEKQFPIHLNDRSRIRPINCTVSWKGEEYFSIGATIFKIGKASITPVFNGKDQIICLSKDLNDNLWIGYIQHGAERYQSFTDTQPFKFPFLDSKSVTKILQDPQRGYWLSTLEDGVYYVPELMLLINENGTNNTKVKVVFSQEGQTFIGDDSGLISVLDSFGKVLKQKRFDGRSILSIFLDTKQNIWVSTNLETYILDNQLNIKKAIPISLSSITGDTDEFIWGKGGFYTVKFNSKGDTIFKSINESSRFIYLTENYIYLFGRLGLNVYTRSFDKVKIPQSFESLKITQVIKLDRAFLLITTLGNGFYIVNQNDWSFHHYYSKQNFIADNIYSAIVVDSTLWLGTEKGVAATQVQPLLRNFPLFRFFTKENGLASNRIAHLSYSKPNIWVFYDDSFSLLPSSLTNQKQNLPTFYLKDVLINNRVDSLENLNKLRFDQNNIQINFGFIDMSGQHLLFRYRLSALSNWNYATERNIKFFSLSPGNYLLELEYTTDNLHWVSVLKHPLSISPQWLMNWRIQLGLLLMLSLVGFLYYRRRIHLLREKQNLLKIINEQQQKLIRAELETLESERGRIAKDLHDSIGTNLAAIKLFLNSFLKKSNEPNASIIEATLQETIQGTKDIIANLAPAELERFGLVEAIKIYAQRTKDQFEIDIEVNSLGVEVRQSEISIHLFRIVQELISNSLKYASAKKITVNTSFTSTSLNIHYNDDGIGFNVNSISKGNGLLNIQSRVQILDGTIKFESSKNGVSYHIDVPLKINQS
jgi:signal transduction histidine kinase